VPAQAQAQAQKGPPVLPRCKSDADCERTQVCLQTVCHQQEDAEVFWRDEEDGGDDPWRAGCHYKYTDAACTKDKEWYEGDACLDDVQLLEWRDQTCTTRLAPSLWDCRVECRKAHYSDGRCSMHEGVCARIGWSANCVCTNAD
jgi:hypothetical protein